MINTVFDRLNKHFFIISLAVFLFNCFNHRFAHCTERLLSLLLPESILSAVLNYIYTESLTCFVVLDTLKGSILAISCHTCLCGDT